MGPSETAERGAGDQTTTKSDKESLPFEGLWNHLLVIPLGVWLMAAPDVMGYEGPERVIDHIVGPLVVSAAVMAMAEVTRAVRWINVLLGIVLMLAPILTGYEPLHIAARSALIGAAICVLSFFFKGPEQERIGGGWRRIIWTPAHATHSQNQQQWKRSA